MSDYQSEGERQVREAFEALEAELRKENEDLRMQLKATDELFILTSASLAEARAKLDAAERKLKAIDTWGKAELIAKLNASERAAAAMREVLAIAQDYVLNLPLEGAIDVAARIDHALDSNAGRDYVLRSEVDIIRAAALKYIGYRTLENEIKEQREIARDAKTTLPPQPALPTSQAR